MTDEEIRRVAAEAADLAARKAVRETLLALGVDADKPLDFQNRMQFLQSMQAIFRTVIQQAVTAFVGMAVVGLAWAAWMQTGAPK